MPGAQPRRSPVARVASAARRGANVPAGVPGVYRVPRTRTVTVQSNDTGAPGVSTDGWVQPDDETVATTLGTLILVENGTPASGATFTANTDTAPTEADLNAFSGGSDCIWQTVCVRLSHENLNADPVSPTPPPGMTVEYEDPEGVLLTATIEGQVIVTTSHPAMDPPTTEVWEYLLADIHPGAPVGPAFVSTGPTHTVAGGPVYSQAGQGTFGFGPLTQTFPAEQVVGWRIGHVNALGETNPTGDGDVFVTVEGTATAALDVEFTYRPPRYRFV